MNAKKLDIDFGSDDFFNTFSTGAAKQQPSQSNKLQEVKDDPFNLGGASSNATSGLNANPFGLDLGSAATAKEDPNRMTDDAAREKLAKMANRKAISSDDFLNDEPSQEIQDRYQAMKASGATQISSDMMFGAPNDGQT